MARASTARKRQPARPRRAPTTRKKAAASRPAARKAVATAAPVKAAPPAGSIDLAGSLRALLGAVDTEVRAVGSLSERIDELVSSLNDAREEQAKRLIVLDTLRASVKDASLTTFLDKAVRPRKTRVVETMPERLTQ